ncbi:MAG: hypothetical protein JJ992_08800 [Planctomycetes bacterium]|nr:hypothetical protein [Planctomycetota bacterium]
MRKLCSVSAAALMLLCAACAPAPAADVSSGIEVGKSVGTYSCTKCGGVEDGVEVGKSLCYT